MTNREPGTSEYQYEWQNPNLQNFDFGRVLGRSFSGIFADIKPLIIGLAIVLTLTTAMAIFSTNQLVSIIGDGGIEDAIGNPKYWMWSLLSSLPAFFFTLWIQLIVVITSYAHFTKSPAAKSPLTASLRFLLPMLVIAIIYSIVCTLGFYALLIGFVFVWPGWALAGPILVHEKKGIFGSLGQAWNLSRGSKRWIFLLLILLGLIGGVIYSVAAGIATVGTGVNIYGGDPMATLNMSTGKQIIFNFIAGIGGYAMYILFASGLTAAYVEVKTLKDGAPNVSEIFS